MLRRVFQVLPSLFRRGRDRPSGAVIVEAAIDVTDVATGARTPAKSNEAGNFRIPYFLPGDYTLKAEFQGSYVCQVRHQVRGMYNNEFTIDGVSNTWRNAGKQQLGPCGVPRPSGRRPWDRSAS